MKKQKILFLGYRSKKTRIIKILRKYAFVIEHGNKTVLKKNLNNLDIIISFGYKKIIKKEIINQFKKPILNLHISFLPYNKGYHPNFWSFIENTPKGVSIHLVDKGIDTGPVIFQKRVKFKNFENLTFLKSYKILIKEIESLFIKNINKILKKNYKKIINKKKGTFHLKKDLPKHFKNWNSNIKKFTQSYNN